MLQSGALTGPAHHPNPSIQQGDNKRHVWAKQISGEKNKQRNRRDKGPKCPALAHATSLVCVNVCLGTQRSVGTITVARQAGCVAESSLQKLRAGKKTVATQPVDGAESREELAMSL